MVATPSIPPPTPFPVQENFPITWPSPEHAMLTFRQDRMHSPFPMTPMSAWWSQHFAVGMTRAFQVYSAPMRSDALRLNTYFYLGINPAVPPEEMARFEEGAPAVFQAAAARAWDRWRDEWLPELKAGWERWNSRDLSSLPDAELASAAREAIEWYERIWTIHFEMLLPAMLGASLFEELYTDLFPDREALSAYRLLQGFDSMSLEAGRELWLIARADAEEEAVARLVRETPVDRLWDAIRRAPEADALKERLNAYLSVYGLSSDNVQELATVSWIEDPTPPLANLKAYIDDPNDPRVVMAQQADERERFLSKTRAALAHHPESARQAFEGLLKVAQAFGRLQEDHNFWIDQRGTHEVRQLCLAIGNRLAARKVIERSADVFLLDLDEALDALEGRNIGAKELVASRRAEMDHWAGIAPPPMVGMDYGPPPDSPIVRTLLRFFGGPPPESTALNELRGNIGSRGKVIGTARVIMSIAEGSRLQQGEILVAPTTAPPWTPLFATAAGIVTETGGVLSHCAIVAREYGIPAVVGAPGATQMIRDGSRIEVDGDSGTVRILE